MTLISIKDTLSFFRFSTGYSTCILLRALGRTGRSVFKAHKSSTVCQSFSYEPLGSVANNCHARKSFWLCGNQRMIWEFFFFVFCSCCLTQYHRAKAGYTLDNSPVHCWAGMWRQYFLNLNNNKKPSIKGRKQK